MPELKYKREIKHMTVIWKLGIIVVLQLRVLDDNS